MITKRVFVIFSFLFFIALTLDSFISHSNFEFVIKYIIIYVYILYIRYFQYNINYIVFDNIIYADAFTFLCKKKEKKCYTV